MGGGGGVQVRGEVKRFQGEGQTRRKRRWTD